MASSPPGAWRRRLLLVALALAASALAAGVAVIGALNHESSFNPASIAYDLKLGTSLRTASRELAALGVIQSAWLFESAGRLRGDAPHIKAGNYEFTSPMSPLALLRKITRGDATQVVVRFIDGWTFKQVRQALSQHEALKHETRDLSDADIALKLGIADGNIEGWIFPDSYYFARGSSDLAVLRRAHRLMQKHLGEQWDKRPSRLPLASPYEALILASIVEKETGRADDRALVSSVFVNRLRIGMRLQTDPTLIYGMGDTFNGNLRRRDLQTDTPWNTYTRAGLPPTPIAMPGLASLQAALNPADSNMFYFVARGDGTSQFSQTLDEHNAAVTKYQRAPRRAGQK
ncbi:MAG: endolytic transglycosylase MltG [Betaproteobacteria bacterium]|nr:endolytic transglycosylase MltG [Betaproteobacteria bacterium]